jgi:transcriptional regulator with XRE-family HTH domain
MRQDGTVTDDAYDYERLGGAIRDRMKVLGMTQTELAQRTGLHRVTIGRLVNGRQKSPPSAVTMQALERALGWLPGSVDAVLRGGIPAIGGYDGRFLRIQVGDADAFVHDLVRKITLEIDPDTPQSRVIAAEAAAEAELRRRGLLPPCDDQETAEGPFE